MQLDYPTAVLAPGPPGLTELAAGAWQLRTEWCVQVSSLQQEVSRAMHTLGMRHAVEVRRGEMRRRVFVPCGLAHR